MDAAHILLSEKGRFRSRQTVASSEAMTFSTTRCENGASRRKGEIISHTHGRGWRFSVLTLTNVRETGR